MQGITLLLSCCKSAVGPRLWKERPILCQNWNIVYTCSAWADRRKKLVDKSHCYLRECEKLWIRECLCFNTTELRLAVHGTHVDTVVIFVHNFDKFLTDFQHSFTVALSSQRATKHFIIYFPATFYCCTLFIGLRSVIPLIKYKKA